MTADTSECPPKKVVRRPTAFIRQGVDYPREDVEEEEDDEDKPGSKPSVPDSVQSHQ